MARHRDIPAFRAFGLHAALLAVLLPLAAWSGVLPVPGLAVAYHTICMAGAMGVLPVDHSGQPADGDGADHCVLCLGHGTPAILAVIPPSRPPALPGCRAAMSEDDAPAGHHAARWPEPRAPPGSIRSSVTP